MFLFLIKTTKHDCFYVSRILVDRIQRAGLPWCKVFILRFLQKGNFRCREELTTVNNVTERGGQQADILFIGAPAY